MDIDRIYREYGHIVLRRARQMLGNEAEAEEIVQEVFLTVLQKPDAFEGRSAVTTFLYAATTNRCLNRIRDEKNRSRLMDRHVSPATRRSDAPVADQRLVIQNLLRTLSEEEASAAVYYFVDEMTHDEISEVIGCSRRQVGRMLERVQERLREKERVA